MSGLLVQFLASGMQDFRILRMSEEVWLGQDVLLDGVLAGHCWGLSGKMALHTVGTAVHTTLDCAERSMVVQLVDTVQSGTLPVVV